MRFCAAAPTMHAACRSVCTCPNKPGLLDRSHHMSNLRSRALEDEFCDIVRELGGDAEGRTLGDAYLEASHPLVDKYGSSTWALTPRPGSIWKSPAGASSPPSSFLQQRTMALPSGCSDSCSAEAASR